MSIDRYGEDCKTILLTGGRAPCTLELARAFRAAGHRVLVAESVRHHLCRVSRAVERSFYVPAPNDDAALFLDKIEQIIIEEKVDVLIPTCEEVFYIAKGRDRIARHCMVWVSSIEQLGELHNKWEFILLAERLGLSVPATRLITSEKEWLAYGKQEPLEASLVLKPVYSRFASQVLFIDKDEQAAVRQRLLTRNLPFSPASTERAASSAEVKPVVQAALTEQVASTEQAASIAEAKPVIQAVLSEQVASTKKTASSAETKPISKKATLSTQALQTAWVAQRRIDGRHICTYSVAFEGELLAHAAYISQHRVGHGASVYFSAIEHKECLDWVRKLVKAIRFTGQIAFDFIQAAGSNELYAIECNPRATSGVHLLAAEPDFVQAFVKPQAFKQALEHERSTLLQPKSASASMLTAAMLAAGLQDIRSFKQLRRWFRDVRAARDVVFSRSDPMPGLESLRVVYDVWRTSRRKKITLQQATTIDIDWNGDA